MWAAPGPLTPGMQARGRLGVAPLTVLPRETGGSLQILAETGCVPPKSQRFGVHAIAQVPTAPQHYSGWHPSAYLRAQPPGTPPSFPGAGLRGLSADAKGGKPGFFGPPATHS